MASTRYAPQPTKKVRDYLQGQYESVSPYNVDLMNYLEDLINKKAEDAEGSCKFFPPNIRAIIMNNAKIMGKDPTFFCMSLLTLTSVMFRGTVVQFNGTERNNLTLFS